MRHIRKLLLILGLPILVLAQDLPEYHSPQVVEIVNGVQVVSPSNPLPTSTPSPFGTVTNTFPNLVAGTPTLIGANNAQRKFLIISNNSASAVNIQLANSTGLSASQGIRIPSQGFYELKGDNLYTGDVYAFCSSTVVITVEEGTP